MNNPPDDQQQSLDELLSQYHIVRYENVGKSETDWYELKEELIALIESTRLEKTEPQPSGTARKAIQIGFNQGADAQMQAILKVLQRGK